MADKPIGKVTHYYDKLGVAVIELTDSLVIGDKIKFVKGDREIEQTVDSMQVEHKNIDQAKKGDSLGLKVNEAVKAGAAVFKLE